MTLKVDIFGTGPDLVMTHGWSLHCGLFDGIADALAEGFTLHFIDLPGHGHNASVPLPSTVEALAEMLLDAAPERAHWLGWSIGGMAAMAAASLSPGRVTKLVTVAATPRFVAGEDWPHAIPAPTLEQMARDLHADYRKTVKNFLSLQVLGDDHAQSLLRDLRAQRYAHGEPEAESLEHGLDILHDRALREAVRQVSQPWLSIMGSRDRLASPKIGEWLEEHVASCRNVTIPRA
ncbi:MAG: pimeloyl-ACP methyl ester esterase BioH, partial [Gammaproteobacteria bacterium]|nr:pimeloyl-ACP methyl ester esterase BioH [Gammaproteobacteria bacterium]